MTKRGTRDKRSATVDHIIPKSRGGTSSPINTVMCCRKCNNEKGNFTGVEYRAWIKAGRPDRADFRSQLPDLGCGHLNSESGSHTEWFKRLYIDGPDMIGLTNSAPGVEASHNSGERLPIDKAEHGG